MSRKEISRWIFLSITYPEQQWPTLLQKAVIPFLESNRAEYLLHYILHFSKYRGDYIGLSCEVRHEECRSFIDSVEDYFSAFFQRFPGAMPIQDDSWRTGSIFMDLPVNRVCHSLHKFLPVMQSSRDADYIKVWQGSSVFLMSAFRNEPFDKEDFFTAVLYLNLLLLLSFRDPAARIMQKRATIAEALSGVQEYREKFNESEIALREVLQDCINVTNGLVRKDLEPIAAWFHLFKDFLQSLDKESEAVFLEDMLIRVRMQLCIAADGKSLLDYFIDRMLQPDFHLKAVG
jgi:hypothetical protein